ncbi:hypothetical protein DIPPA_12405 [Diplonema papillatum]|nr:hypothetical protein DIPPA_12405 [Diplonema papillatum]
MPAGMFAALFPAPAAAAPELLAVAAWGLLASGAQLPEPSAALRGCRFSSADTVQLHVSAAGCRVECRARRCIPAAARRDRCTPFVGCGPLLAATLRRQQVVRGGFIRSHQAGFLGAGSHTAPSFGPPAPFKKVTDVR